MRKKEIVLCLYCKVPVSPIERRGEEGVRAWCPAHYELEVERKKKEQ